MAHDVKLGNLIDETQRRDAIHIAVAPVVAAHILAPGEHIGFIGDGQQTVGRDGQPIGIVDPFLKAAVKAGDRFWMLLYPQTITSLRHDWVHPAFRHEGAHTESLTPSIDDARRRIKEIAFALDMDYDELMSAAKRWEDYEDYTIEQGSEHWRSTFPQYAEEFWALYETVTGRTVDNKESFFSCSC